VFIFIHCKLEPRTRGGQSVPVPVLTGILCCREEEVGVAEMIEVAPVDPGDWDILRLNQTGGHIDRIIFCEFSFCLLIARRTGNC
jgi:hypothetical protein